MYTIGLWEVFLIAKHVKLCNKTRQNKGAVATIRFFFFFLIGIHSMQG